MSNDMWTKAYKRAHKGKPGLLFNLQDVAYTRIKVGLFFICVCILILNKLVRCI